MSYSTVDHVEVGFADGGTANGSTGHDVTLLSATVAAAADWDVIFVGSDTTVTTPSGFTLQASHVGNQGGYCFTRKCTGGESATVRVKTTGDFSTVVLFSRNRGLNLLDVVAPVVFVDSFGAGVSPTPTTGTLASVTDTVIAGSTNTDAATTVPVGQTWSAGYTEIGNATVGTGAALGWATHAVKAVAGTASESPVASWTNNMRNRYAFVVAFTAAAGGVTLTDSSGGAAASGSTDAVSKGIVSTDGSGGAAAGGSPDAVSSGKTLADGSGGAAASGSADTVLADKVTADASGGAAAGGSADTVLSSGALTDGSGGAAAGGSADTVVVGKILVDGSGGSAAGGSSDTPSSAKVFADASGGAAAGGSPDTVSAGGASDITISDRSGGAAAGGSLDTLHIGTGAVQDTMVMPVLLNAMTCLETEENKVPSPVAQYMIRPGSTFVAMADDVSDECCAGIGWVRPGPMWESDEFPSQRAEASRTDAAYYAVQVELGVIRCLPTISNVPGAGDAKPTKGQWTAAVQAAMDDAAALRRTICCLRELYGEDAVVAGQISPLENEANCAGMTVVVTMRVPACDCVEV